MYSRTVTQFDLMMKTIMVVLFVFGLFIFFVDVTKAADWVNNPSDCPIEYAPEGVSCSGGNVICGITGAACIDPSLIVKKSTDSSGSQTVYSGSFDGGYILNCTAVRDSVAPYCDNSAQYWCNSDASCSGQYIQTICSANKWAEESSAFSCATTASGTNAGCFSGRTNCDANADCETIIGSSCSVEGLTGTKNASCGCTLPTSTFVTGIESKFSTTSPLLWGAQYGTGDLLNFGNATSSNIFIVKNDGTIFMTSTASTSSAPNQFYNYNGDLYWGDTKLNTGGGIYLAGSGINLNGYTFSVSTSQDFVWTGQHTFSSTTFNSTTTFPFGIWGANGRVGIGTTTLDFPLTVTGDINITGNYLIDGISPGYITLSAIASSTYWDEAYGWGDHSLEGYLKSFTETDPNWNSVSTSLSVSNFTTNTISQWVNNIGYITSSAIVSSTYWDTAYSWGDHSLEGYLTSYTTTSPAGSSSQIQFNNNGSFGATTTFIWDNANGRLGIGTSTPIARLTVDGEMLITETSTMHDVVPERNNLFSLGSALLRWLKGWFVDLDVTNLFADNAIITSTTISSATITSSTLTSTTIVNADIENLDANNATTTNLYAQNLVVSNTVRTRQYCDVNGNNCYDPTVGWVIPISDVTTTVMVTSGLFSYNGKVGYQAANEICSSAYTGYHFCFSGEIISFIRSNDISEFAGLPQAWIAEGPPGYTAYANDCGGFTTSSISYLGAFWEFNNLGGGQGWLSNCSATKALSCCK